MTPAGIWQNQPRRRRATGARGDGRIALAARGRIPDGRGGGTLTVRYRLRLSLRSPFPANIRRRSLPSLH